MKQKLLLCFFLIVFISPAAVTQNDLVDQEKRLTRIEVTVEQTSQTVNRIVSRLDSIIMWIVGLIAASFISTFALILQIKTQLNELNLKFGLLQKDVSTLNEKFDGLEKRVDGLEEKVDGLEEKVDGSERRIGEQLNQIQKALSKQLGMDIDDPLT